MVYERDNIRRLKAYVPGEQPDSGDSGDPGARSAVPRAQIIKLNTNENPYPPSPAVLAALRGVDGERLRRYPSPTARRFREVAARIHNLTPDHVIATNGGDELLRLAVTVFCDPLDREDTEAGSGRIGLGTTEPTYSLYKVLAAIHDTRLIQVPLNDDFSLPNDFADKLNQAGAQLAIVVNPHSPSGQLTPLEQLARIAEAFDGVLLIDEAYVDFATHDALPLLMSDSSFQGTSEGGSTSGVLLLRSMSKGYSLAGLRFGYGLGHPDLIRVLDKARDSYNTDVLGQVAATAALEHREEAGKTWRSVIEQRQRLHTELTARGYTLLPSQANFVLATPPPKGPNAGAIYESLKQIGVLVRYFDQERLQDKLRITIGSERENERLLAAIDDVENGGLE